MSITIRATFNRFTPKDNAPVHLPVNFHTILAPNDEPRLEPNWKELSASLGPSLSGPLDDYIIEEQPYTASGLAFNVTSKWSYKDRFQKNGLELATVRKELAVVKMELKAQGEGFREKLRAQGAELERMQLHERARDTCLKEMEIYNRLWNVLQSRGLELLPGRISKKLGAILSNNLAYAFALLWTIRNHRDPVRFPLPLGLRLGRAIFTNNPTIGGISHYTNLLIYRNGAPTRLGAAVWEAWQQIGAIDRELMLFCWTVKQAIRYDRSRIPHPAPTFQSASLLLSSDLEQEEALPLRHRAIQLISESRTEFPVPP